MKTAGIVAATFGVLVVAAALMIRMLARRVVGVEPRRKTVTVRRIGETIELPRSELTLADGSYGLWFGEHYERHALIGPVVSSDADRVIRRLLRTTAPISDAPFEAQWTGHIMSGPAEIDPHWEDVSVPLRDGGSAPAWLFPGTSREAPWVIHVQGIRTSRLVTLRSVAVAQEAGLTSLAITYRGSGDGPPASASTLGQREWSDLADAIAFARSHGATAVYVVAWSMGAGLALELLRREPAAFDKLALIAPATNWRAIIRHGVRAAGLPKSVATAVIGSLASRLAGLFVGMPTHLDFEVLGWSRGIAVDVPTIVIHSRGDAEIPFELSAEFSDAHAHVALVETPAAPHGWEANVAPALFAASLTTWLQGPPSIELHG